MLEEEWGYREEWSSQERKASLKMNYWYHHFSGSWSSVHRECPSEVSTRERRWNIYPQASILSCELPQDAFNLVHLLLDWSVVVPLHHVNSWGGIRDGLAQNAQSHSAVLKDTGLGTWAYVSGHLPTWVWFGPCPSGSPVPHSISPCYSETFRRCLDTIFVTFVNLVLLQEN